MNMRRARTKSCLSAFFCVSLTLAAPVSSNTAHSPDLTGIYRAPFAFGSDKGVEKFDPKDAALNPPDGPKPLYTPEYAKKTKANEVAFNRAAKGENVGPEMAKRPVVQRQVQCLPHGMPMTMRGWASLDIIQKPDRITMIAEFEREIRRIWLDRPLHDSDDVDPGWWGYSVGKWEGDTLVVTTIGIRADLEGLGFMAHSDKMVITERIHLVRPDVLHDELTVTDPIALKKPWSVTLAMVRLPKSYEPSEYVCDRDSLRSYVDDKGNVHHELGGK
jgi:hypothetical protein